jgi:hypothetical protein
MEGAGYTGIRELGSRCIQLIRSLTFLNLKEAIGAGNVSIDQAKGYAKNVVSMKVMAVKQPSDLKNTLRMTALTARRSIQHVHVSVTRTHSPIMSFSSYIVLTRK